MKIVPTLVEVNRKRLEEMRNRFGNERNSFCIRKDGNSKILSLDCIKEVLAYVRSGWNVHVVDKDNNNIYNPSFDDATNDAHREYFESNETH